MTSNTKEIADIEKQLGQLEELRNLLGNEITDQKQAGLKAQLSKLRGEVESRVESDPPVAKRDILSSNNEINQHAQKIHGPQTNITGSELQAPVLSGDFSGPVDASTHYHGTPPIDLTKAEEHYRESIADRCGIVPLQSMDDSPAGGEDKPLSLAQIYISLDTRQSATVDGIEAALEQAVSGQFEGLPERGGAAPEADRERETRPVSALEATILHRCLVLTGEPGSGKSTFVNHLTYALARREWACLPGWPEREGDVLPLPVTLREFARWVSTQPAIQSVEIK